MHTSPAAIRLRPSGPARRLVREALMTRKSMKTEVVAFKVEEELAEFLNQLPNKSAFIRKAIAAQMSTACPLCHGSGQVSRGVHDRYEPLIKAWKTRKCQGCGGNYSHPTEPADLSPT